MEPSMFTATLLLPFLLHADPAPTQKEIPLWEGKMPGPATIDPAKNVPTITYFPAKEPNGTAVVICPGGGYGNMAMIHEGREVAEWLNARGVTAFVLKYRISGKGSGKVPEDTPLYRNWPYVAGPLLEGPMMDVQRAIQMVRRHANDFHVNPDRVGVWGFSAGGHLASTCATHHLAADSKSQDPIKRVSSRPDFAILSYPVITMGKETHGGSKRNLLGEKPDDKLIELFSNEKQVTKNTPPTFLFHTVEDKSVLVENSRLFKAACEKNEVSVELVEMEKGAHGIGLGGNRAKGLPAETWPTTLEAWMKKRGLLEKGK
jgi:acetyl esterase/lipase